jgi:hypothetical protein
MARTLAELRKTLVERVLAGPGVADPAARRAAFANDAAPGPVGNLVQKVTHAAASVTDEDIARVKKAGVAEDQIFELSICAALGQASRQLGSALAALDAATSKTRTENAGETR